MKLTVEWDGADSLIVRGGGDYSRIKAYIEAYDPEEEKLQMSYKIQGKIAISDEFAEAIAKALSEKPVKPIIKEISKEEYLKPTPKQSKEKKRVWECMFCHQDIYHRAFYFHVDSNIDLCDKTKKDSPKATPKPDSERLVEI